MVNTALYVRVSTQEQANEGYSIQEQIDRLTKYTEAMKWKIYKIYMDPGFSGGNLDRPGLQSMLKDIQRGHIDKVLVYKLDRLSRSQKDTLNLIEDEFLAKNVDFISMNENFDTSTPFGRAMVGILAVFAQLEREQIKERMLMGREARAKEGKFPGAPKPPIGYDYINGELKINEYSAMIIKDMFNKAAKGMHVVSLVKYLNETFPKADDRMWTIDHVKKILRSKTYAGYIRHKDEWLKGIHEPIISEELYDTVQSFLDDRLQEYRKYHRRNSSVSTYLGGFLFCARCGARYSKYTSQYTTTSGEKRLYPSYMCNSKCARNETLIKDRNCKNKTWRIEKLDNLIFDQIKQLALDPDHLPSTPAPDDGRSDIIKAEISKVESQISKAMDLYLLDSISKAMVEEKLKNLNVRKLTLEEELTRINKAVKDKLTQEQTVRVVKSFDDILKRGNYDEIRTVIGQLIQKILIDGDDVTIYWNF